MGGGDCACVNSGSCVLERKGDVLMVICGAFNTSHGLLLPTHQAVVVWHHKTQSYATIAQIQTPQHTLYMHYNTHTCRARMNAAHRDNAVDRAGDVTERPPVTLPPSTPPPPTPS